MRVLMPAGWSEHNLELGDTKLHLMRAGSGRPVLVLHHDIGTVDRLPFYDALAERFDVIVPRHPGFGVEERPNWMRHPRDIAALYQWALADLGVERASLVGLGFGGWVAAEMAALAPRDFHRLVLVGAMGVKPPEGDIFDQAIVSYIDYARAGFHDQAAFARIYGDVSTDQLVAWDLCREMCFRIAWKPYMYSLTLPRRYWYGFQAMRKHISHRLEAIHVQPDPAASVGRGARPGQQMRQGQAVH